MIPVTVDPVKAGKALIGVAALAVIVLIEGWLYHKGYTAGEASKQAEVVEVRGQLTTANAQIAVLAQRLEAQNASIEDARRKAQEAKAVADVAEAVADAAKKDADAKASDWQRRLREAQALPECAVLTMPLCPSVTDY